MRKKPFLLIKTPSRQRVVLVCSIILSLSLIYLLNLSMMCILLSHAVMENDLGKVKFALRFGGQSNGILTMSPLDFPKRILEPEHLSSILNAACFKACITNDTTILELMLRYGADPNLKDTESSPVMSCVGQQLPSYDNVVNMLVKYGAKARNQDEKVVIEYCEMRK